jgi:hypothetical protein
MTMSSINLNITVREFIELVPVLHAEIESLVKRMRELEIEKINSNTKLKEFHGKPDYCAFYGSENTMLEGRKNNLSSILKKMEKEMVDKFEPKIQTKDEDI